MNAFTIVDPILWWLDPIIASFAAFLYVRHAYPFETNWIQRLGAGLCIAGLFAQGLASGARYFEQAEVSGLIWLWSLKDWGLIMVIFGITWQVYGPRKK